jgi:TonB family protein
VRAFARAVLGLWAVVAPARALAIDTESETPSPREPPPAPEPAEPKPPPPPGDLHPMPLPALGEAVGWIFPEGPDEVLTEEQAAQERLDRALGDVFSRHRMRALGADPWYQDAGRAMQRAFRPDMRELERERRAPMTPVQRVVDELARYAQPPRSSDQPRMPPHEMRLAHNDHESLANAQAMGAHDLRNAPVTWYRVDLRVTHGPEGQLQAVWVLRSSGYRSLDEAALAAVRHRTVILEPPPSAVMADRQAIRSDWAFEAADVATYWNDAGCVDSPGGMECAAAGRGITRTRIRLLRVLDAQHPPPGRRPARTRD